MNTFDARVAELRDGGLRLRDAIAQASKEARDELERGWREAGRAESGGSPEGWGLIRG